jgi:hypothetical protein
VRRILLAFLPVLLILSGCDGGSSGSSEAAASEPAHRLRALPFGDTQLGLVRSILEQAGVGIDRADRPVRVTAWQAQNMALEAANGGGVPGATLDALAPVPDGSPPVAFLLAAWITTYDSPGARFVRALLGDRDWHRAEEVTYPLLALTLFLADASGGATASPTAFAARPVAFAVAGPCTAVTEFVQKAINTVANMLKVNTSGGGFLGFLGKIWNTAVDLATGFVKGLIDIVTRPVVNLLVNVFGVVATIAQAASFLTKWRVVATPTPEENRFGILPDEVTGTIRLSVDHDQVPIPGIVVDCAAAVGVDLRDVGATTGSKVTWTENDPNDLATRVSADEAVKPDHSATYTYRTSQETPELAKSPNEHGALMEIRASVQRNDVEKVRELFTKLLLDQIPDAIRSIVEPLARQLLDAPTRHLAEISDVDATVYVAVLFHTQPDPTPSAPMPAGPGGQGGHGRAVVPTRCPDASVIGHRYSFLDSSSGEPYAPADGFRCVYVLPEQGTTQLHVLATGTLPPTPADPPYLPVAIPGTDGAWIDHTVDCYSNLCYGVLVFAGGRALGVVGGDADRETILAITRSILGVG